MARDLFAEMYESQYGFPSGTLSALIKQESGGNPAAVSPKGARGLTQVMPATARDPGFGVQPMRDESTLEQLRFGADYLNAMVQRYGSLDKALAAYNAGPGAVDKYGGVPPFKETQGYVSKILGAINPVGTAQARDLYQEMPSVQPVAESPPPAAAPAAKPRDLFAEAGIQTTPKDGPFEWDTRRVPNKAKGAPPLVRADVAAATSRKDKLATLRRYYPDAVPYGDDNFKFTNERGESIVLDEEGLTLGDIGDIAPELFELAGGGLGGAAGMAAGPIGAAVGTGVGAGLGKKAYQISRQLLGEAQETRGLTPQTIDLATTMSLNMVAGEAGRALGGAVGSVAGKVPFKKALFGDTRKLRLDFSAFDLVPLPGTTSGKSTPRILQNALANSPGSASIIQAAYAKNLEGMQNAVKGIAGRYGSTLKTEEAGRRIRAAASQAALNIGDKASQKFEKAYGLIGEKTPVQLSNLQALRQTLTREMAGGETALRGTTGRAVEELDRLLADAKNGTVPVNVLKRFRTDVGEMIQNPVVSGTAGGPNPERKRIYAALTADLEGAARQAGGEAISALESANRYYRAVKYTKGGVKGAVPLLEEIAAKGTDKQVFNQVVNWTETSKKQLIKLTRNMTTEEKGIITGSLLGRLGETPQGWSPTKFLTQWGSMTDDAKNVLFEGSQHQGVRRELDRLVRVAKATVDTNALSNPSGTARIGLMMGVLGAISGTATGLATGSLGAGAVAGALGPVAMNYAGAKLLTSKRFVNWLADLTQHPPSPSGWGSSMSRLVAISSIEPELSEPIGAFIDALETLE